MKHYIQLKIRIFLVVGHSILTPAKDLQKAPVSMRKVKQIRRTPNSSFKTFFLSLFLSFFALYL